MYQLRLLERTWRTISASVLMSLFVQVIGVSILQALLLIPFTAFAAQVNIDTTVSTSANANSVAGSQNVFVSDQVGYTFYVDSSNQCVYKKTLNGGATWGATIVVDSQTDCLKIVVWYDRWTPGDATGNYIHISTMDSSLDHLFYNRLDTTSDTLLMGTSPVDATINSGQAPTYTAAANAHTMAKATDGKIYLSAADASDSFALVCSASCNLTTSWTEVGPNPFDFANDFNFLAPLSGGSIMAINRDVSADDIRYKIWNGTNWSSWVAIDLNAPENATYDVGMGLSVDTNTGDLYLVYAADNDNAVADHDIRTAIYTGGAWSNKTDVLTNVPGRGVHTADISFDLNNNDVYVSYSIEDTIGTAVSANIYWVKSTDGMTSWGAEQGPINSAPGNIYGPFLNMSNFERIYATWYDPAPDDRFGETIADIGPDTILTAAGTQVTQLKTGDTNNYIGGKFALTSLSSRTVSTFQITEKGTVDAQNNLNNIKLFYDLDTSSPYDCASESYSGSESQFGITDTNGFSGADGSSNFTGSLVAISPTQTMCLYVVLDVMSAAADGATIEIEVTNPSSDITVSGTAVYPATPILIPGTTTVVSPNLTQIHYHWRNDNGTEVSATSATGGIEDTSIPALQRLSPRRLRVEVSNEGSTSTAATFRLEYGTAAPTCNDTTIWTDVGATDDAWNMYATPNLTEGGNTTNIAVATGGVTNENTTFLTPNGGVRDISSTLGSLTVNTTNYVEMEFSVIATLSAVEGESYCFRVTNNGVPINTYSVFPRATIDADIRVTSSGTHIVSTDIPSTNKYFGGVFAVKSNADPQTVTGVTIAETGTVNGETGLSNVKLFYENDTSNPYDCVSESYAGTELQFGVTDADGFSSPNGTSTFTGSVGINNTSTLCLYVVADVTTNAANGETVAFEITSPTVDVVAGAASVAPGIPVSITGSSTLVGGILTQTHYHWRNDDGGESTSTSATVGVEDTPVLDFNISTPIRIRLGVSNEGATSSTETRFRLEYGPKISTCSAVSIWTDVDSVADDSWDMFDSTKLVNGEDTTNIANGIGGVTDENTTFKIPNGGVRDTESLTSSTTLTQTQYVDFEYSIKSTAQTAYSTTYCFRVTDNGKPLPAYTTYPEITTTVKRDFKVQRGTLFISSSPSVTLVAGVDYVAPAAANKAFIRITNSNHTGAGDNFGGGTQNADDTTAYISNPENIMTSVTLSRTSSVNETFVDWEIVEFIGIPTTDNEMIVRDVGVVNFSNGALIATGTSVSVSDDSDVVVYVTGSRNQNTSRNYYAGQVTSAWSAGSDEPVFTRDATGNAFVDVSYAVVEYVGQNWKVQRAEHTYVAAGVTETESITAVNSLERTFIHTQKRLGAAANVLDFGHTVWLSSIGAVSFEIESGSNTAVGQTSVAWIIENTQGGSNAMKVQRQSGNTLNGTEPLILEIPIPVALGATNNSSIFLNSRAGGVNTSFPRPIAGARITSVSTYEIWRSDTGATLTYRTELVEWPVADLSMRQNYYRFYADNNTLTPSDPWPIGAVDLGENTSITETDDPLGVDEYLRLRMSIKVANASLPAGFQKFKLQYAERLTTCTAAVSWYDLGDTASSSIWRGYAGVGTTDGDVISSEPPIPGDLLISVSDVAGRLVHQNPSTVNAYTVYDGEDIEYDWFIQHNGAGPEKVYCFRMIKDDDTLLEGYFNYPQIRTAGFVPASKNWRWYSDPQNETPVSPLAAENVAPTNININDAMALRVTVNELSSVSGIDVKFKLQFSDDVNFANPADVVSSSTCIENSIWCYVDGGGTDNALITTSILSDGDGCVGSIGNGCGVHNSSPYYVSGHTHDAIRSQEYSFTIKQAGARVNDVYYFRLVEISSSEVVSLDTGETYPSVQTGPSSLTFSIAGLPAATSVAGVVTDLPSSATGISFGSLPFNDDKIAAQSITVSTNATEGYQVLKYATQQMINSYGIEINPVVSTNAAPGGWATVCTSANPGCVGYHTTDATLENGSARFGPSDTYAPLSTTPEEIMYSSIPSSGTEDIVFRVLVTEQQPAGDYTTNIVYLAVPVY